MTQFQLIQVIVVSGIKTEFLVINLIRYNLVDSSLVKQFNNKFKAPIWMNISYMDFLNMIVTISHFGNKCGIYSCQTKKLMNRIKEQHKVWYQIDKDKIEALIN